MQVRELVAISAAGPLANASGAFVGIAAAIVADGAGSMVWGGVAVGMAVAAVIDLVPVARTVPGVGPRMTDGAVIRAALRRE